MHQKRWSAWPHERIEMSNPRMGEDCILNFDVHYLEYHQAAPFPDNVGALSLEHLEHRKIIWIDLVDSKPQPEKKEESLRGFVCPEAGITSPLKGNPKGKAADESVPPEWTKHYSGEMMCAVTVVTVQFKWRGLQAIVEKHMGAANHERLLDMGRSLVRLSGEWCRVSLEDAMAMERRYLDQLQRSDARGVGDGIGESTN
jgi:hypothetical protein